MPSGLLRLASLLISLAFLLSVSSVTLGQTTKPKLKLDEFFNFVSFPDVKVSPDGASVVIETERADWDAQENRKELWLYRTSAGASNSTDQGSGRLIPLTQSARDTSPQWSPDGRWIAFLSERKAEEKNDDADNSKASASRRSDLNGKAKADGDVAQLFVISPEGGEAIPITSGEEEVHAFVWTPDSKSLIFSTRQPWSKKQKDAHKKEWKDVSRYRGDERGDVIFQVNLEDALSRNIARPARENSDTDKDSERTSGAVALTHTPLKADSLSISPNGKRLGFLTSSVSERQEKVVDFELFVVNLQSGNHAETTPLRLTRNEAVETRPQWALDNRHLFFQTSLGSPDGKYEDPQPRLYWVDAGDAGSSQPEKAELQRWFASYPGEIVRYTPLSDGSVLASGRLGTEVQLITQANPKAAITKREGWAGTYELPSAAAHGNRIAFAYSATTRPTEIYLAEGADTLAQAKPITSFNKLFTERDLPQAKPYRWTSDDGTKVEGMLMYPPGKFEAKNLPTFVFIHGGPQDADGNHFEADWYQWDRLAATAGWLVFEPNYRGSTGYGDKFALGIVPEMVSRPGKDILTGVDALVKDGIADSKQLAIGGYSYGGYMTNWLITQTTRFKAAVTGAGAVENVANWGNDDTTFDDAYFLGGLPWEAADRYRSEAAIFQINKVRTPTHMVAGANDIRVSVGEDYLLDRALHELNVPSDLLIFPGEGHSLRKNPWHGKIKVREELKWLEKYGGVKP